MRRLLTGVLCLTVAGFSAAGDCMPDHVHDDVEQHTHEQSARPDPALQQARHLQRHHKFGDAAKVLEKLIDREPLNQEAQLLYADVLLHDGRADSARAACVRVGVTGAHTLAGYCAVQVLTASGEYKRAFETARALSHDQLNNKARIWALEISAVAAWKAGYLHEAEEWFRKAIAYPDAPHSIGQAYADFLASREGTVGLPDMF